MACCRSRQVPKCRSIWPQERSRPLSAPRQIANWSARSTDKSTEEIFSSFLDNGGGGNSDLVKLRFVRYDTNAQFGDGEQRFGILQIGDGFAEPDEISLRQFDQPVVLAPSGQL